MLWPFRILKAFLIVAIVPTVLPATSFAEGVLWCGNSPNGTIACALEGNYPTSAQAQRDAITRCNAERLINCRIVATFRNGCYAYAFAQVAGGWGAGGGHDLTSARRAALATCQRHNPGVACYVHDASCDTVDEQQIAREEQERQERLRAEEELRAQKRAMRREERERLRRQAEEDNERAQREREAEDQDARRVTADMTFCFQGDHFACERLLKNPAVPISDLSRIERKRQELLANQMPPPKKDAEDRQAPASKAATKLRDLEDCERYDLAACHRISVTPLNVVIGISHKLDQLANEATRFNHALKNAQTFAGYLKDCASKTRMACDAALQMPAITDEHRSHIAKLQAALPVYSLDDPTHFIWTLVAVPILGFLGFLLLARRSPANVPARPLDRLYRRARQHFAHIPIASLTDLRVAIARLIAPDAVSGAAPTSAPVHPDAPRDPETARAALQLVHSYLTEVPDDLASQVLDQPQMAGSYRSTLALAAKQLDIAERADPTAKLVIEDDGEPVSISQQRLRARMIALEALTWTVDKPRKEIRLLTQATQIDPSYAPAFHLLGTAHLMTRNRTQAIAALERACALDPGNIQMLKALDRARNMTDAEIATFRLSNAAAKTTAAGIKTWNILKLVWIFGLPLAIVLIVAQFTGSMLNAVGYIVGFYVVSAMFVGLRRLKDWFDDFHV